jgi:tripartite-type tricarboxylate transporter receptor subunit TctC
MGNTLFLASLGNAVNATLYDNLKFNFIRDMAPVASISREPLCMEVNPSFPAKTVSQNRQARALSVTTATPSDALPGIPVMADFLPGYEASAFYGITTPKNTPVATIEKLNQEINGGLADPKLKGRLADLGASVLVGSPADFGSLIAEETEKWGKVIRAANIKAE